MATTTFEQVNTKLQSALEIPQWHKEIVSKRIEDNKKPVDAFEMLDNLDV